MNATRVLLARGASGATVAGSSGSSKTSRYPPPPSGWTTIIGIETHAQLCSDPLEPPRPLQHEAGSPSGSKLFSDARLVPSAHLSTSAPTSTPANSLVTPFDAAYPGTLPRRLQQRARHRTHGPVHQAVRTALALQCQHINHASRFDRKHYFYPDLTPGYQITQKYQPLAGKGIIPLRFDDGHLPNKGDEIDVEVECIQLEQDTAKSTHVQTASSLDAEAESSETAQLTLIDLNRSGSGLMEIVSGPDLRTPDQAGAYIRKLQEILRTIGASDGSMDEGSLRCDVNVSVHRPHLNEPWGTRIEIKNLNSAKFVMQAISHETHRQVRLIEEAEAKLASATGGSSQSSAGTVLEQETRGFDEKSGMTFRLRSKEHAPEYRFMPDPNLPPLRLDQPFLDSVRATLPELPETARTRLIDMYGLSVREANVLLRASPASLTAQTDSRAPSTAVAYFEALAGLVKPRLAINWTINELMKSLNGQGLSFEACPITPDKLAELLLLLEQKRVTGTVAKTLLPELIQRPELLAGSLESLLENRGVLSAPALSIGSNTSEPDRQSEVDTSAEQTGLSAELEALCATIIQDFPTEAKLIRAGKHKIVMKLVGEVMKRTRGTADAVKARELFVKLLSAPAEQ